MSTITPLIDQVARVKVDLQVARGRMAARLEALLGHLLIRTGDLEEALRYLHHGLEREDAHVPVLRAQLLNLVGNACLLKGEPGVALSYHEKVLAMSPELIKNERLLALIGLARVKLFNEDQKECKEALTRFFDEIENVQECTEERIEGFCLDAELGFSEGQIDIALSAIDGAGMLVEQTEDYYLRAVVTRLLAFGEMLLERFERGVAMFNKAIGMFEHLGARRELARCHYEMAIALLEKKPGLSGLDPLTSLARAHTIYEEVGNWKEHQQIQAAFRHFGRRVSDKLGHLELEEQLQVIDEARAVCLTEVQRESTALASAQASILLSSAEKPEYDGDLQTVIERSQAIVDSVFRFTEVFSAAEGQVIASINTILSDRENVRHLLDASRKINELGSLEELTDTLPNMALRLSHADQGFIVLLDQQGRQMMVASNIEPEDCRTYQLFIDEVLQKGRPILTDLPHERPAEKRHEEPSTERRGTFLGVPIRGRQQISGALFVSKRLSGGFLFESDLVLLSTFAFHAGIAIENAVAHQELRLASMSQRATISSISEAVIAFDRYGRVTLVNPAACRAFAREESTIKGMTVRHLFQGTAVHRGFLELSDLSEEVVQLQELEALVNASVILGEHGQLEGYVVTFTELKQARHLAQRLVGSTARFTFEDIIFADPAFGRALNIARIAANSDSTVLIEGPSGVGKEMVAQSIHNGGDRAGGSFVAVHCAAIPRELLESELFGYEEGAFTGARRGGRPGKFELADGGTILLDEIGDMPLEMQVKLLRVLQERVVQRVGGQKDIPIDVRVIVTTNRGLAGQVAQGNFREDLFYRLRVIHLQLPPLRYRPLDIAPLAEKFVRKFARSLKKDVVAISDDVMKVLVDYHWPGNVRELENVLEGVINLLPAGQTHIDMVPDSIRVRELGDNSPGIDDVIGTQTTIPFAELEKLIIIKALKNASGSIQQAARALQISRGTIYNKLKRYGISVEKTIK